MTGRFGIFKGTRYTDELRQLVKDAEQKKAKEPPSTPPSKKPKLPPAS